MDPAELWRLTLVSMTPTVAVALALAAIWWELRRIVRAMESNQKKGSKPCDSGKR